jgi:pilus assembly protein Flp/PilA
LRYQSMTRPGNGESRSIMKTKMRKLATDESGQDLIEYALVAALVGLGAVVAMKGLSNSLKNSFNGVGTSLTNA